ncbi:LysR family transcriptional regulator [Stenotrophomonas sp. S48]|uniref:LysR family transcriptional regulator n=1 Tax=unclassified Stenotrophomonas TaxID=196198 RepID=UPI0019006F0C|nr:MULTISPECIES: LysR family transcriptional regulator [unclassified Stenotrophomonas]MBK0026856.1 LysR family transcriptional regulator [Stenotrophomonas sp. S48]MBK0048677.1 LysR family transcriptional regulator [Stenotrophomonas sp. S49]
MNLLESMQVYVLIVDKGSLSAAAAAMDISATMAGKHLRALEARLGMQLLSRTTRRQHMTPFGQDYYARCRDILRLVEETDAQAAHQQLAPAGMLRVSAPVIFGTHALVPALADYMQRHPQVQVEVTLNDRVVDLAEEGFEAALRIGSLADSDALVARPLTPYRLMMCAAPTYLAQHGTPRTLPELADHQCLSFEPSALSQWVQDNAGRLERGTAARLQINNGEALRTAALHGLGIVLQSTLLLAADVAAGRLVQLFPQHGQAGRPMHVVYARDRYPSTRLRSFVEFLVERFPPVPNP